MNKSRPTKYITTLIDPVYETRVRDQRAGTGSGTPTEIHGVLNDASRLTANIESLWSHYQSAKPFPHLVLENLFSKDLLECVANEMLPPGEAKWVRHDDEHLRQFNLRSA